MAFSVSVIIPCYNQGHYLGDALGSLEKCDRSLFETIIVNDGSTEENTLAILSGLEKQGYRIIHRKNGGLSAARNTGIQAAGGEYVIMLDADNMIRPSFIEKGIDAMRNDTDVAVVYGNGNFFGDETGLRKQSDFNLQKQLLVNYIDACAMIRKSVFSDTGYFDEQMREGWEDWEMWLRIAFKGYRFCYIDDIFFDYRIRKDSMSKSVYQNIAKTNRVENYVYAKYPDKMGISHVTDFFIDRFRSNPVKFLIKLFIRAYKPGYYNKLLKSDRIRNGL